MNVVRKHTFHGHPGGISQVWHVRLNVCVPHSHRLHNFPPDKSFRFISLGTEWEQIKGYPLVGRIVTGIRINVVSSSELTQARKNAIVCPFSPPGQGTFL